MNRKGNGRVKVRAYVWNWNQPDGVPGVLLRDRRGIITHLSTAEARGLADKIHDICDEQENATNGPSKN